MVEETIPFVDYMKYLGIFLEVSWNLNYTQLSPKPGFPERYAADHGRISPKLIYQTVVKPMITYFSVIW